MLMLTGRDSGILKCLADALSTAVKPFVRIDLQSPLDPDQPGLFEAALRHQASTIILVESLPRLGDKPAAPDHELFDEALRATRAPGVSLLILVTARAEDDEALQSLRQSGTPYVILRAPAVIDLGALESLKGRKVLITDDARIPIKTPPVEYLVSQILGALKAPELTGRTLSVEFADTAAWARLLEEKGARPLKVGALRARVGRWLGQLQLSDLQAQA